MPESTILDRIRTEIRADPYYAQFFPNEGRDLSRGIFAVSFLGILRLPASR